MPQPTATDVHVNQPLTNISVAFMQDEKNFIADKVFPIVPVLKQGDSYYEYERDDWFRIDDVKERALSAESEGGGYNVNADSNYYCRVYSHHKDIDDRVRANTDSPLDSDRDSTMYVSQKLLLKREVIWATKYFKTNVWSGGDPTPSPLWSAGSSYPAANVAEQSDLIFTLTGLKPNVLVIGPAVYTQLKSNADVKAAINFGSQGIVTLDLLAPYFDVDKVLVARGIQNTAVKGQSKSMANIFGKHALLVYAEPNPGLMKPSGGYTFTWKGYLGSGAYGNRIKKFRMDALGSDRIEGEMAFDQKVIAVDLGCFFDGVIG